MKGLGYGNDFNALPVKFENANLNASRKSGFVCYRQIIESRTSKPSIFNQQIIIREREAYLEFLNNCCNNSYTQTQCKMIMHSSKSMSVIHHVKGIYM